MKKKPSKRKPLSKVEAAAKRTRVKEYLLEIIEQEFGCALDRVLRRLHEETMTRK